MMRVIYTFLIVFLISVNASSAWALTPNFLQRIWPPKNAEINQAVALVSEVYQSALHEALKKAGCNAWALIGAIKGVKSKEREGMAFLIVNMPIVDLRHLKADYLIENVQLAYQVMRIIHWRHEVPHDIFLNDILPYAIINERRDNWRTDFYERFIPLAQKHKTITAAVLDFNATIFKSLDVSYNLKRRPKPEQSPYDESIKAHYASCTGLSVLLVDALRAVGIPARLAGTALWKDQSGNHTWVEIWDGKWHYVGAGEPGPLDHAWFTQKAAQTDAQHPIYATHFQKTNTYFPMVWSPQNKDVYAVDVTARYKS